MSAGQALTSSNSHSTIKPDAPVPSIAEPSSSNNIDSTRTSSRTSDCQGPAASLKIFGPRPRLGSRKSSGTMIVPHDHPDIELKDESFPPNDARAMSPKRSSAETGRMIIGSRLAIQSHNSHAEELQSGLNALVEKVENIKSDHEKLEKNNNALQDYIGGLTRSMSRTAMDTGRKK